MLNETTTIAALATAPAPAGIAIVRVSGPQTRTALRVLFRGKKDPVDHPRTLIFGELIDHKTAETIDSALAVYMPNPHSFTGEDVAEFQFHGSPLLVQKILRSLYSFGLQPAQPGEFTRRAFLNGKLDLVQAEAIAEVINASSEQALKIAGEHLKGKFSDSVSKLGEPLRDALAELEASIDFPEEDINPQELKSLKEGLSAILAELSRLLSTYAYGQIMREGFRVLLCGKPNAGKSSLLNRLLGTKRAIVSEVSGTTRDLIEESMLIAGHRFVFCDSAGLTESSDSVEMMGIALTKERVSWADLVLFMVDAADPQTDWEKVLEELRPRAKNVWMVVNKIDINPSAVSQFFCRSEICHRNLYLSAKTGNGIEALSSALVEEVSASAPSQAEANQVVTNERQRSCLEKARSSLESASLAIDQKLPLEIISAELRSGLKALEELVGRTYTEDILGRIFSKFCIGK